MARRQKLDRKQRRIRNRVTLRTIFLLSVTLIFNTYAWFAYATTVSTSMSAHVEAWKVEFEFDSHMIDRVFNYNVDHAYPGMPNNVKTLMVSNTGEKDADLTYEIRKVRIFDDIYISTSAVAEGETVPEGATTLTPAQLLYKVQNDYPFTLSVTIGQGTLLVNQSTTLTITFSWAYETGNDATDTNFGTRAIEYYEENDGEPVIQIELKLIVTQHQPT